MHRKNRKLIRFIAIALAVLLAGGVIVGAVVGALAEERPAVQHTITAEYMAEERALRVTQRLDYTNRSGDRLDRVVFYAAGNLFRRQAALIYEDGDLAAVFPEGFLPGGIDLRAVRFNGADADHGFQGADETVLRVACDLAPGESGAFEFEYYLLLTRCAAFNGVGDTDVRLGAIGFVPGVYDEQYGEFVLDAPLAYARWLYADAADYDVTLTLPENCALAATGEQARVRGADGAATYRIEAEGVRDFALCFGKRYREQARVTDSGVRLRALSNVRGANRRILDAAERAVAQCEAWFGPFPCAELEIAQTDYPLDALNAPGLILLPGDLLRANDGDALAMKLRFCVAQQYFGLSAYARPSADAWLSDSVSAYVSYLLLEEERGRDAFLSAINRDWVDAVQLTIPGGLVVSSDARLFDAESYDAVVRVRGAVVLHELRVAMGLDALLDGLAGFWRMGTSGNVLTEMDFVRAMDAASGQSWEAFLTDWVFNVGEYVNQTIDWYE